MNEELTAKVRAYLVDAKPDPDKFYLMNSRAFSSNSMKKSAKLSFLLFRRDRNNMAAVVRFPYFLSADGRAAFRKQFQVVSFILWRIPMMLSVNPRQIMNLYHSSGKIPNFG